MIKNKKNFRRYPICMLAVFFSVVLMLNMLSASAIGTINVGIDGLSVSFSGDASVADTSSSGFAISVASPGQTSACTNTRTVTVVFENTTSNEGELSFDYSVTGGGSSTVNGNSMSASGSTGSISIPAGSTVIMSITSPAGHSSNVRRIVVSNLKYSLPASAEAEFEQGFRTQTGQAALDTASLWKLTVTPGTGAIESLSVKVDDRTPAEGSVDVANISGASSIVYGVVIAGTDDIADSIKAVVNGDEVATDVTNSDEYNTWAASE